jgi:hypothetical protein
MLARVVNSVFHACTECFPATLLYAVKQFLGKYPETVLPSMCHLFQANFIIRHIAKNEISIGKKKPFNQEGVGRKQHLSLSLVTIFQ